MRKPPKNRNPEAMELARNPLFRTRVSKTVEERAKQNDPWERSAKHKAIVTPQVEDSDDG